MMPDEIKIVDHPAYRFCSYCGAENTMITSNFGTNSYIICRKCLEADLMSSGYWDVEWNRECECRLFKLLLQDNETDEATKVKIAAKLLSKNDATNT